MEILAMREMFWTGLQSVGGGGVICSKKVGKGGQSRPSKISRARA